MQKTLGIDLSSDPKKTAACLIVWGPKEAEIETLISGQEEGTPLADHDLIKLIGEANRSGIDAPFGWPKEFVEAVSEWQRLGAWPEVEDYRDLKFRATDLQVTRPRRPLSVSSNLIGVTAMRCAGLLNQLDGVDRTGASGPVIEIYPAAALVRWGLPAEGYKGRKGQRVRKRSVSELCRRLKNFCSIEPGHRKLCEENDNALDAIVASLVVRASLKRKTTRPKSDREKNRAPAEGWIHIPTCELEELA